MTPPIMKKLTHIAYYKYQQRILQRRVFTRNSSNSRLTSLKYFYKIEPLNAFTTGRPFLGTDYLELVYRELV